MVCIAIYFLNVSFKQTIGYRGSRLEKLEEMQVSIVRRRMHNKLIRPAMLFTGQKRWIQRSDKRINEMRMLWWMYGVTRKDKIRNEHLRGTTRVMQGSKTITEVMSDW